MLSNKTAQDYIYSQEKKWFEHFRPYLHGKTLKVGNGLGYFASFMSKVVPDLTIIDIHKNEQANNIDQVQLYDGVHIPFEDKMFDCAVCTLVLHHTPDPQLIIKEMRRVARRLIIFEETYTNLFSKLDLVGSDIVVNGLAGQPSSIFWHSYFKTGSLDKILAADSWNIIKHQKVRRRIYQKELFVVDEPPLD